MVAKDTILTYGILRLYDKYLIAIAETRYLGNITHSLPRALLLMLCSRNNTRQ